MVSGLRDIKKEKTRLAIANAGVALFLDRGFDGVSVADIAAAAEVSKMTVFNYFPAKEDIFFFLRGRAVADLASVVQNRSNSELPINAIHEFVLREIESRAEWTGLHEGAEEFGAVIRESAALQSALRRRWAQSQDELADALTTSALMDDVIAAVVAAQITATVRQLVIFNSRRALDSHPADNLVGQAAVDANTAFSLLTAGHSAATFDR